MKVVVDTNVLVSGLLNPNGAPGEIVGWIVRGKLSVCHNGGILAEYEDVLSRSKFRFKPEDVSALLDKIRGRSEEIVSHPLKMRLTDQDDEVFLEVALSASCEYLVTGNTGHFPSGAFEGVRILSPAEFVRIIREQAL